MFCPRCGIAIVDAGDVWFNSTCARCVRARATLVAAGQLYDVPIRGEPNSSRTRAALILEMAASLAPWVDPLKEWEAQILAARAGLRR